MDTTEKLQARLNKLLGNGAIKSITVDQHEYIVNDEGCPEHILIEFENGKKVTIEANSQFDGCGDLDYSYLLIEDSPAV